MAKPRINRYAGPQGLVDDVADASDIRGAPGAAGAQGVPGRGGSGSHAFATQSEVEAIPATVSDKVTSPEAVQRFYDARKATDAEAEATTSTTKFVTPAALLAALNHLFSDAAFAGATDKWEVADLAAAVVARLLPTITDAATDMGKIARVQPSGAWALEDFTPSSGGLDRDAVDARVTALVEVAALVAGTLNASQQAHFRGKIGAAGEGEWDYIEDRLGTWGPWTTTARDNLPTDTQHILPDNCVTLRIKLDSNNTSFVSVDAAELRRKVRIVGAQTALDDSNSVSFTDPGRLGNFEDDQNARVALDARGYIYVYVDQAAATGTGELRSRRPRHASWSETDPNAPEFIEDKPTGLTDAIWRALRQKVGRYPENPAQPDWNATSGLAQILNKPDIEGAPRAVQALPARGTLGERLELINPAGDTVANPTVATPIETRDNIGFTLPIAGVSRAIALFSYQKTGSTAGRLIVGRIPAETRIPAAAVVDGTEYALQRQAGIGASDYITAVLASSPLTAGTPADFNVRFTDGSFWFAPVHKPRGFYEWTGHVWGAVTAALNDAATFAKLHDGTFGLSINTDRSNQSASPQAFDTPYTLPGDHIEGVLNVGVDWSSASPTLLALGATPTHHRLQFFLSDLRATTAYSAGTHDGLLVSSIPVTTAPGGTVELRVVRDASNAAGLVLRYVADGSTGGVGQYSVQAQVRVALIRQAAV